MTTLEAQHEVITNLILENQKLKQERDEAREKIKRQAERIRELEGATNHAGGMKKIESIKYHGTDETDAMVELWESCHLPADFARRMEAERNEARRLADTRLDQLEAITSSEPKDYLGLVYACKSHRKHIAQLIKERDEAIKRYEEISRVFEGANEEEWKPCTTLGETVARILRERDEAQEELSNIRKKLKQL